MKKLFLALALLLTPASAWAQCNGVFANNTVCGNATGSSNLPRPTSPSAFSGTAGGTNGQTQYNNVGTLAGYTPGQDCTVNVSTGAFTCLKTNNVAFTTAATTALGTSGATIPLLNGNNTYSGTALFSGTARFTGGISQGTGVAAPATADFYNYSATRSVSWISTRDAILTSGTAISDATFLGQNASGTTKTWVDNYGAVPYCRGRTSVSSFQCATTTTTAGTEEGAFYITTLGGNNAISLATTAGAIAGTSTLTFASSVQDSGNLIGKRIADTTNPTAIPAGTYIKQQTSTTLVLSQNIAAPGVSSGDTIPITGNDMVWADADGLFIGGQRNMFIPAGQGLVSFDSSGTATYLISYNSHGNNALDIQTCNNIGVTCAGLGSARAFSVYTSAAGAGQPTFQISYDNTITINATGGGTGTTKLCLDASKRLTTTACP